MTTPADTRRHGSTDHIFRMVARLTSVGYVAYLILLLPAVAALAPRMDPWWTPVAVIAVFGSGVLPGLLSLRRDTRPMRIASGVAAAAFLLVVFSWPLAWTGQPLPGSGGVWLAALPGLAGLAAATTWPAWVVFAHLMTGCIGVQAISVASHEDTPWAMLLPAVAVAILYCMLFVGAAVMALRTIRVLDTTTEATHAAAARHARAVERERFDALIHDGVMSTLLTASRQGATPSVSLLAARTLGQLDTLRDGPGPLERVDCDEALSQLRAAAADVDEDIPFSIEKRNGAGSLTMPVEAARALAAALAEGLRNSCRHAGESVTRSVGVTVSHDGIAVLVADDGRGFDPRTVPADRLGVSVSIRGRMQQLDGGSARIVTAPGAGTRVHLGWSAP